MIDRTSPIRADEVRAARSALRLSATEAAALVGINDGAQWRRWERDGVKGPAAVLLRAIIESRAVRRYFGLSIEL